MLDTLRATVTSTVRPAVTGAGRLLYRGPSLTALHELARTGTLDEHASVRAAVQVRIAAPRDVVWRVLADLAAWPTLDIGVTAMDAPADLAADRAFRWTNGGMPITSRLAVVDEGRELSWTGVTYGVKAIHRQILSDEGADSTLLRSEETMAAPLLAVLYPSHKLQRDLTTFVTAFKRAAESAAVPV